MRTALSLSFFLLCSVSLLAQQPENPQQKAAAPQKATKPELKAGKPSKPALGWEGRIFPGGELRRFGPFQRLVVRPAPIRVVEDEEDLILVSKNSERHSFKKFVDGQISRMVKLCDLSAEQTRKLRLAAKGVVHRERVRRSAAERKPTTPEVNANARFRIIRLVAVPTSDDFQKQLDGHKLWTRTLEKVLTSDQRSVWKNRPAEKSAKTRRMFRLTDRDQAMQQLNLAIEARRVD